MINIELQHKDWRLFFEAEVVADRPFITRITGVCTLTGT